MKILLDNGTVLWVKDAKDLTDDECWFMPTTARGRILAYVATQQVAAYWWDNENVATEAPNGK